MREKKIRFPAVAGQFYPEDAKELKKTIEVFLGLADVFKERENVVGMLVPHAGYLFSGTVAAYAYKAVYRQEYETIILIGDSHYQYFDGVSLWERGEWRTPLGSVKIDEELAKKILNSSKRFLIKDSAHLFEHSLEVQLPFLQKTLKNFKILPIIFGSEDKDWKLLAETILSLTEKRKILIIGSSDLSHYPDYHLAKKVDQETIEAILTLNPEKFTNKISSLEKFFPHIDTFACAQDTIKTILEILKRIKGRGKLLKYQNSGDSFYQEKTRVVGYASILFEKN